MSLWPPPSPPLLTKYQGGRKQIEYICTHRGVDFKMKKGKDFDLTTVCLKQVVNRIMSPLIQPKLATFFWETLYIKGLICQHACPEETLVFVSIGRWKEGYWGQLSASSWRSRRGKEGRQDRAVNGEFLGWKREEILRSIIKRGEETGQKPAVAKAGEAREDFLGKTDSNV